MILLIATVVAVSGATAAAGWSLPTADRLPPSGPQRARAVYRPPTDAPVLDPFRPPPQPWLSGNRGIEYGTAEGAVIRSIGPGRVAFVGPVAGRLVVSIDHPGGLRSTYTGLAATLVARGEAVAAGAPVATAPGPFHLGVRRGDRYLDPASLWGTTAGAGRVRLVPSAPRRRRAAAPDRGRRHSPWDAVQVTATLVRRPGARLVDLSTRLPGPSQRSPPDHRWRLGPGPRNRWRGAVRDGTRRDHEATARGPSPLRPPDPPLEPEDEAVHLR